MGDAHSAPFQKVVPDLPGHSPHMCQMHVPPREQHSQLLSQASPGEPAGMLLAVTTNSSSSPEAMAGLGGRAPVLVDLPFKDFLVAPPPHDRAVWHLAARKQTASVSSEQILVGCGGFSTESTKLHNLATTQEDKMTRLLVLSTPGDPKLDLLQVRQADGPQVVGHGQRLAPLDDLLHRHQSFGERLIRERVFPAVHSQARQPERRVALQRQVAALVVDWPDEEAAPVTRVRSALSIDQSPELVGHRYADYLLGYKHGHDGAGRRWHSRVGRRRGDEGGGRVVHGRQARACQWRCGDWRRLVIHYKQHTGRQPARNHEYHLRFLFFRRVLATGRGHQAVARPRNDNTLGRQRFRSVLQDRWFHWIVPRIPPRGALRSH
eukprot:scaffold8183_cov122-Isochrysis_galbana.AAC.7